MVLEWTSFPLLIIFWLFFSWVISHRLFPSPLDVIYKIIELLFEGALIVNLLKTFERASISFIIAMLIGSVIGIILGKFKFLDRLFNLWILIALNLPAIVVAIALFIWLGMSEIALIAAVVINKAPLVCVIIRQGYRSLDINIRELSEVYRVSIFTRVFKIVIPQLMPHVLNAARTGLSLIWKIVLVFEILGSDGGVGFEIGILFQYFDITGIIAYAASFMLIVIIIEYFFLRTLENKVLGWHIKQQSH